MSRSSPSDQDADARKLAETCFDRPLLFEAGAGTGKTGTLVDRLFSWCTGPGWEQAKARLGDGDAQRFAAAVAEGVVAITFTEKAAAEMAERVAKEFKKRARGQQQAPAAEDAQSSSDDLARARAFVRVLDRFTICTIHAFCHRLLARYPLESGLHPGFRVDAEGIALEAAVDEVVWDFLAAPPDKLLPAWRAWSRAGASPDVLCVALVEFAQAGVEPTGLEAHDFDKEVENLAQEIQRFCKDLAEHLQDFVGGNHRTRKAQALFEFCKQVSASGSPASELVSHTASIADEQKLTRKLEEWARRRFSESEGVRLGAAQDKVQNLSFLLMAHLKTAAEFRADLFFPVLRLLAALLLKLQANLKKRQAVTFQALLSGAVGLLEKHTDIAERERERIKIVLVDEFQDTDPLQARLVELLALGAGSKPSLFLVGDPKQTIYAWRSADLRVYDEFKKKVKAADGIVESLRRNRRSVPRILEEVNRVVAPRMSKEEGYQPEFQELLPWREKEGEREFQVGVHRPVEYWVAGTRDGRKLKAAEARRQEAEALARHLRELHDQRRVEFKNMAVLLRATTDSDVYLQAMRKWEVKFTSPRDRSYFQRREVMDAVCLLRAIVDPLDTLALVGFLRSPWAGVPDPAWLPLRKAGFFALVARLNEPTPELLRQLDDLLSHVAENLPPDMPQRKHLDGWEAAVSWALGSLAEARRSLHTDLPDVFVEKTRLLLAPEVTEAARFLGPYRVENLQRLLRHLARGLLEVDQGSDALVRALRRAVEELREDMTSRPSGGEDAVLVTTIHQAKGLEREQVFVVDLHRQNPGEAGRRVKVGWVPCGRRRLAFRIEGLATPNFHLCRLHEEKVAEAETVRLLYVAMTRAKQRLVLSGHWPDKPSKRSLGSLLCDHPSLPDPRSLAEKLGKDQDRVEEGDALWVFLGAQNEEPPPRPGTPSKRDVGPILEQSSWLGAQRTAAAQRQALPWWATISAEAHHAEMQWSGRTAGAPASGESATRAGSLIHEVLEGWDLRAPPQEELAKWIARLPALLPPECPREVAEGALGLARGTLERFSASPLFGEFCALKEKLLGRELPLLLTGDGRHAAGCIVGVLDLLYREPTSGELVVVDFKTDRAEGEELDRRVAGYRRQGELYCRAVQQALELPALPHFELWFLHPGRVVRPW